jgi:hypothetical protein
MSLASWAENGWLQPHKTSREEINNLLAIVERELTDAGQHVGNLGRIPRYDTCSPQQG